MELSWSIFMFYCAVLFLGYVSIQVFILLVDYNRKCRTLRRLPQPPSHWLYGHSREIFVESSKSFLDISTRTMEEMDAKVFLLWMGPFPIVQVCHPETFKQVNQKVLTKDNSMSGPYRLLLDFIGEGLLGSNGKKWERNRKLLTPAFHFNILSGYVSVMNKAVDTLTEKLETATVGGKSVDVFPYVCRSALDVLVTCSLSYEGHFQDYQNLDYLNAVQRILEIEVQRYSQPWQMLDVLFYLSPAGRELKRLCKSSRSFTEHIIKARKAELKNQPEFGEKRRLDFLDILLTARDEQGNGLTFEEIHDEVDTFTFAGHDTTACTISWTIYALGLHREAQELVYQDVCAVIGDDTEFKTEHLGKFSYLTQFVKETMRFYSPVPVLTRRNEHPIEIDGYEIPTGCSINIQSYLIHHNKHVWTDHNEFKPERFNAVNRDGNEIYGFLPFSAGSRNCIGQVFAMNEVKITIAKLVKKFEVVKDPDYETDIRPEFVMRPSDGIKVFLKKRFN
ncbi:cytochrome P450 4A24-like [Mercenaria mercenaria]|uniref:cytochrome P450 4A24-like n=1 Tax=Mercenaria mercenaria TaxID=6596 RepID=UPI00234E56FD|nr:cytochrome P450 4A24-like [Mercenaria mercenaria]